jgi:hypothetical protein
LELGSECNHRAISQTKRDGPMAAAGDRLRPRHRRGPSAPPRDGLHGLRFGGCPSSSEHLQSVVLDRTDFVDLPLDRLHKIRGALLCDVMEDLPEPIAFLDKVRMSLPALERVLLTVPARQELWSNWDQHHGHFRRYDLQLPKPRPAKWANPRPWSTC